MCAGQARADSLVLKLVFKKMDFVKQNSEEKIGYTLQHTIEVK